ncbi:hypothetical protein [Trinickia sp. EG282A]|uniref:hypothetical protein n=1 Tax=Trinickia sp. EG282A TaxID=3237013 RepID=UPI0034D2256A
MAKNGEKAMADLVSRQQLIDFLTALPSRGASSIREGFAQLSARGEQSFPKLVEIGEQTLSGVAAPVGDVAVELGVSEGIADLMLSASSMTMYACGRYAGELTPNELSGVLLEAGLLANEDVGRQLEPFFALVLERQSQLRVDIERQDDARSVLPNLMRFDLNVDVRVKFQKNEVKSFLPVVIGHMDTDAEGQLIWFQMTKEQLLRLQEDITDVLDQVAAVEAKLSSFGG